MINLTQNNPSLNKNSSASFKGAFKIPFGPDYGNGAMRAIKAVGEDFEFMMFGDKYTGVLVNNLAAEKRIIDNLGHMQYVYNDKPNMTSSEFNDFINYTKMRVYDGLDLIG